MRIHRIDHVAVCVRSIDAALPAWVALLGLQPGPREFVAAQKTDAAFLLTPEEAECSIELIAPGSAAQGGTSPGLEKFLDRLGGKSGLHHIAFAVDDVAAALDELDRRGVPLIDKVPRPGARGHLVGFLHPSAADGVLLELVGHGPPAAPRGSH